jgi:hypothetical protein
MQSSINNSNNYDASASISNSDYEKNEYYAEFGLAKGQKKDSKTRNYLAAQQAQEREKKVAEHISLLPKKMQAKLQQEVVAVLAPTATTGKTKTAHATKPFYDRQNKATQAVLLDDYAEQCVAEDDAHHELRKDKIDAMYAEEEERQYQEYLEKKQIWDNSSNYDMSTWELMCLGYDIKAYETKMAEKCGNEIKTRTLSEYEASTWKVDDHYNDYERAREEEDEAYKAGLEMWLKYGLTKAQYDANREYESNVKALNAFYREPDYQSHPDYAIRLKAAIKKYEDDFDAEQKAQALKDEQNEWWIDPEMAVEDDFDDREMESYEDWLERQEEERIQSQRENAIDDMRDDY